MKHGGEAAEIWYSQDPHPQVGDTEMGRYNCRSSPQGANEPIPTSGSPAQGSWTKKMHP